MGFTNSEPARALSKGESWPKRKKRQALGISHGEGLFDGNEQVRAGESEVGNNLWDDNDDADNINNWHFLKYFVQGTLLGFLI